MGGSELRNSGFSLIEVLIAMSILTIGLLAVVSMQGTALKVQSRNKIATNIQLINQEIMEIIISSNTDPISYNGIKTNDLTTKPTTSPANVYFDYFRSILSKYKDAWAEINVTKEVDYKITITIYWKEGILTHKLTYTSYIPA